MKIASAYSKKTRKSFETTGESLTQQHFQKEADVHNIIKQYDRTGLIANVNRGVAQYGDYSEVNEYREALDLVNRASQNFGQIPSEIREKFNNDAGEFFEFATNPKNHKEMVEMGLANPIVSQNTPGELPLEEDSTSVEPPPSDG
jgi:phage internal scaffolding protein